ncbi:MAG: ABC transporter ATP-binding protein [Desulfobacterales bacterium]|nr:ABC transporter ATP-binding protein [Desulfobacterales bacterium]
MNDLLIRAQQVSKTYTFGEKRLQILDRIDFCVKVGEFVAIMGPSGSGKSTLMHILGCMDRPSSGKYLFSGADLSRATDRQLARIRSHRIGFVFQSFNLIFGLDLLENVELPFIYAPPQHRKNRRHAMEAIAQVGLSNRIHHRPSQLSGGEMQRAAIARALAVNPELILADEPTGNLDARTGQGILDLLSDLHTAGKTIVLVTHDQNVASCAQKVITLENGTLH